MLALPAYSQDDADLPKDDAIEVGQSEQGIGGRTDADVMSEGAGTLDTSGGTVAFGVVYSNGQKKSGTPNWTSSYNSTEKRYEISINGESYYYLNYATNITPAGDIRFCRSSSVSGKLLVYCYDKNGNPATARFGFATFKAP
jgi:hypothetical protein